MALRGFAVFSAAAILCLACEGQGPDCLCLDPTDWEARLTGAAHVPPVTTNASGTATFHLIAVGTKLLVDPGDRLAYSIVINTLPTSAIVSATLHQAAPNANSSAVAIGLCGTGSPAPPCATLVAPGVLMADTFAITRAQLNVIRSYGWYLNVSTGGNPNGEIRGQVRNTAP